MTQKKYRRKRNHTKKKNKRSHKTKSQIGRSKNKVNNNKYVMNGGSICSLFTDKSGSATSGKATSSAKSGSSKSNTTSGRQLPTTFDNPNKTLVYTGIQNLGGTCYINSTIQMLWSIPEIRDYILSLNYETIIANAQKSYANQILFSLAAIFQSFNLKMKNPHIIEILTKLSSVINYDDKTQNPKPDPLTHQDEFEFLLKLFQILETIKIKLSDYLNINTQTIKQCYFPIKDFVEPLQKIEQHTFLELETYDIYTEKYRKEIIKRFNKHTNNSYFKTLKEYQYLSNYKKPTELKIQILLDNYQKHEIMNDPDSYLLNCLNESKEEPLKNPNRKGTEPDYFNLGPGYRYNTIRSLTNNLVIMLKRFKYDTNGEQKKIIDEIIPNNILNINDIEFKLQGCIISLSDTMTSGHYVYLVFNDVGNPEFIMDDSVNRYADLTYLTHGYLYYYRRI